MDSTNVGLMPRDVPTYQKYTIGIEEAASYYGIGEKKLRQIINDNPNGKFYIEVGRHFLLKRKLFEEFLDNTNTL